MKTNFDGGNGVVLRRSERLRYSGPVLFAGVVATILWVNAGDLNPPPGPITPTQRTPIGPNTTPGDTFRLFMITQPGSYYLTGNITGVSGKSGIEIAASGVTLDLMGFDLLGVAGSLYGIRLTVTATDITVVNGSVRNWAQDGVDLHFATNIRLADLRVSGNSQTGIFTGDSAIVTGCAAYQNGSFGIKTDGGCTITNCSAFQNTGDGISTGNSTITNCSASQNTGDGISTGNSTITNCSAILNTGHGINGSSCTITDCSVSYNTGDGIFAGASTITNCSVVANTLVGISAGISSTITNCSAFQNTGDGIYALTDCTVRGNTCKGNGFGAGDGAGIHAPGSDNRIEGNNCTDNDRGIDVDVPGNFITRNVCSTNTTNWDVVAGNVCLVVSATTSAAILGNSGGVAPGSTDPNANFTY